MKIENAFKDANYTPAGGSAGDLEVGSTIAEYAEYAYDATNRRIWKKTYLGGEHDATEHYYYSGWSLVEVRNGSGTITQQHVWDSLAGHYIDSLAQTLNDTNESLDGVLEDELYALQDQQYNVLALIPPLHKHKHRRGGSATLTPTLSLGGRGS